MHFYFSLPIKWLITKGHYLHVKKNACTVYSTTYDCKQAWFYFLRQIVLITNLS